MRVSGASDLANVTLNTNRATGNLVGSTLHGDSGSPGYAIGADGVFRLAFIVETGVIDPLSYSGLTGAVSLVGTGLGDTIMANTYGSVPKLTSRLLFAFGAGLIASQRNRRS